MIFIKNQYDGSPSFNNINGKKTKHIEKTQQFSKDSKYKGLTDINFTKTQQVLSVHQQQFHHKKGNTASPRLKQNGTLKTHNSATQSTQINSNISKQTVQRRKQITNSTLKKNLVKTHNEQSPTQTLRIGLSKSS